MTTEEFARVNRWIDTALPLIIAYGLSAQQIKAMYDAFRASAPLQPFPRVSKNELIELMETRAQLFVSAVLADKIASAQ